MVAAGNSTFPVFKTVVTVILEKPECIADSVIADDCDHVNSL